MSYRNFSKNEDLERITRRRAREDKPNYGLFGNYFIEKYGGETER